jgi:hypothetical protein
MRQLIDTDCQPRTATCLVTMGVRTKDMMWAETAESFIACLSWESGCDRIQKRSEANGNREIFDDENDGIWWWCSTVYGCTVYVTPLTANLYKRQCWVRVGSGVTNRIQPIFCRYIRISFWSKNKDLIHCYSLQYSMDFQLSSIMGM